MVKTIILNIQKTVQYDKLLDIYILPTLIQLTYILCSIQHCITTVLKWIFDRNLLFVQPLNSKDIDNCCNDKNKKARNCCEKVWKTGRLFPTYKIMFLFINEHTGIRLDLKTIQIFVN